MLRIGRPAVVALALCLALGVVAVVIAQPRRDGPYPSALPSENTEPFDPRNDAFAMTGFGEQLVVHRAAQELSISLASPDGLRNLASFDLPDRGQFVVARQLVCADGTGPERSLVIFGAASPASVVGTLRMELFDGSFTRTSTGLFLFVGTEPPLGGKAWVINRGLETVVSGSVVLAMPIDPDNPPPAPCDDWDPVR